MEKGVRQGCLLGPLLFNLVFDCAIKTAIQEGLSGGVKVKCKDGETLTVNRLAYADDLCLLDEDYGNITEKPNVPKYCVSENGAEDQHWEDEDP